MIDEEVQKEIDRCVEHNKRIIKLMLERKEIDKQIGELIKRIGDEVKENERGTTERDNT